MIGKILNHFKVLDRLGKGGMGEVYVAEDSKLKRKVALKVLPEEVAGDPVRLDRFQREAETIAALNHPNIVTIYSIEEADGIRFLTMELVEGETLIQVIPSNGMDVEAFSRFSIPVAEALSAAHEKGIIHRDLKPGNRRPKISDLTEDSMTDMTNPARYDRRGVLKAAAALGLAGTMQGVTAGALMAQNVSVMMTTKNIGSSTGLRAMKSDVD